MAEFEVAVIVGLCGCMGFILKKWVKDVDDKYIPTILCILGILLNIWINGYASPQIILGGMVSALASTGAHQAYKQMMK